MTNQLLPGVNTIPNSLRIEDITTSMPMMVTVTLDNTDPNPRVITYQEGMTVKIYVPKSFGMFQANGLIGRIREINGNVFNLDIDSSQFDPFVVPANPIGSPPSLSPAGSRNLEYDNTTRQVPFQSLNNIGN